MSQPLPRPDSTLVEPQADDPMPFLVSFVAGGNYASPAYYISWIVKEAVGFDIFGWASEKVTGDWEAVKKAAGAAGNLGRFNTAFAQEINTQWQQSAGSTWHGNAAANADQNFDYLASCLKFQVPTLEDMDRELTNISTGMRELGRLVGDLLQDLADWAILAGISLAAEAALVSTGVGSIVAVQQAAMTAYYFAQIVRIAGDLVKLVNKVYKAIYGTIGLLHTMSSRTTPSTLPPLPNSTYDFPGA
ncbi:hypothetical protein NONO_c08230 [Nocardia nova SH22a]|uniref:ESX-1 secretion-associated protein EspA/EspE-like domain-containing protein n=1 Tax=Nocardia nova SH22a TaxID=1415166 RepID=W5T8H3_9NOCA|nr:hypothetical protein [Nocardia nova]AHH15630.1 hypothetical protein NONO_c08230 [Nocardia nova SH22a]